MPRPLDYVTAAEAKSPVSRWAVASLLASLSPLLACFVPWVYAPLNQMVAWCALAGPAVGVVAGTVALARLRRRGGRGMGLAVAGVTTGAVLCAMMVFVVLTGTGGASVAATPDPRCRHGILGATHAQKQPRPA